MIGTLVNALTVLIGSALGLLIGDRLSQNTQGSVVTGLGFVTLSLGMSDSFKTGNAIIPLVSIALGVIIGEALDIQGQLSNFGGWLEAKFAGQKSEGETAGESSRERFIRGYVTASLVFCVGPLTVLGSLADGMSGDYEKLLIKSALDLFAAMAFASSLGIGVMFSVITILVVQGSLALAGALLGEFMTPLMINEMTATGGLILMGLSLILMDIKQPRVANYLPALIIAPLIMAIADVLNISVYPNL